MSTNVINLFGDEFDIKIKERPAKDTIKKAKEVKENTPEKALKSKKISLHERLAIIEANVLRILGKQKDNVIVIKDKETFDRYISEAIKAGRIAIDTETNNSLDPVTCKLMGPCFYYPGGKQAYVPINHRDPDTKERLDWQLTEEDCREEFQKINDSGILQIYHNGKFDYEVIYCTCGIKMKPGWDTQIAARLLNENEPAALKWQYVNKIDKTQEKYNIEELFKNVAYADVKPEIFALYAATDSFMTDKLYVSQNEELDKDEYGPHLDISGKHTVNGLRWVFHNVEIPISIITAEMELKGVKVDVEFGDRLKKKYNGQLKDIDSKIDIELKKLESKINTWKLSQDATLKTKMYPATKTKMSLEKIEKTYPEIDKDGKRYKWGKAKIEQLEDPINLASPIQLAILFYDILKVKSVNKSSPRATGEEELEQISEENDIPLCKLLLKRRGIVKLISTYIDVIPELAKHWPDERIRFHLNSLGTDTGRYSSGGKIKYMESYGEADEHPVETSGINIQNIPSHNPEIRMLFKAQTTAKLIETDTDVFEVEEISEVELINGWKYCEELTPGDMLLVDGISTPIKNVTYVPESKKYLIGV